MKKTSTEYYNSNVLDLIDGIHRMEDAGWSVRQIIKGDPMREWIVVYEREV